MAYIFNNVNIPPHYDNIANNVSLKEQIHNGVSVWKSEQTIFSNVSGQTGVASGPYEEQTAVTSEFAINFSDFTTLQCAGTAASVVTQTGEYSTYGGEVWLSVFTNGQWNDRFAKLATTSGSNIGGTYDAPFNQNVSIASLSGNGKIRLYLWCRAANATTTAKLYCKVSGASAIAS